MAQRIEIEDIVIPAGVLRTAPQTFTLPWREGYPDFIEFRFPPGPSGTVGVQLFHSGRRMIPKRADTFLISDDEIVKWELEGYPYNSVYTVRAFNEGNYQHTIQLRMGLNEVSGQRLATTTAVPIVQQVPSLGLLQEGLEV